MTPNGSYMSKRQMRRKVLRHKRQFVGAVTELGDRTKANVAAVMEGFGAASAAFRSAAKGQQPVEQPSEPPPQPVEAVAA